MSAGVPNSVRVRVWESNTVYFPVPSRILAARSFAAVRGTADKSLLIRVNQYIWVSPTALLVFFGIGCVPPTFPRGLNAPAWPPKFLRSEPPSHTRITKKSPRRLLRCLSRTLQLERAAYVYKVMFIASGEFCVSVSILCGRELHFALGFSTVLRTAPPSARGLTGRVGGMRSEAPCSFELNLLCGCGVF